MLYECWLQKAVGGIPVLLALCQQTLLHFVGRCQVSRKPGQILWELAHPYTTESNLQSMIPGRWYHHTWLKADYKPDSPPPPPILWVAASPQYLQISFLLLFVLFFWFLKILNCQMLTIFFSFSLTYGILLEQNFQNATPIFIPSEPNFMTIKVVMGEYKVFVALWYFC